ncbi:MAG: phosphoglycolate phosphatase [Gammaproteobacteria bacterium]
MGLSKPEMILIDVDGTLVDSVPDLAYCVNVMMERIGMQTRSEDSVRMWVGNGVQRLVERALVDDMDAMPEPALMDKAYPIFLDLYAENTSKRSLLYPGVREALDAFRAAGYPLGCVTNKAERFTLPLLRDLGIHDDFSLIISGDTLSKKKPDPEPLLHAARHFGVTPAHALMIGDSVNDVTAARAAGFGIVCVSYGYNHGQDIRDVHPDAVVDSMAQICPLLEKAA